MKKPMLCEVIVIKLLWDVMLTEKNLPYRKREYGWEIFISCLLGNKKLKVKFVCHNDTEVLARNKK